MAHGEEGESEDVREYLIEDLLYEEAFAKAREFDRGGPPSSIFEDGTENAALAVLLIAREIDHPHDVSILRDVYDSLTGRGAYRLKLTRAKRGRTPTGEEALAKENAGITMLRLIDFLTERMGKREAAVAAVTEVFGYSRSTVFDRMRDGRAAIKRRKTLDTKRELLGKSKLFPD